MPQNDDESVDLARRARPVTDETRTSVRDLAAAGLGRNEIARELDIAAGTVTKVARELGIVFDRSATQLATAARQADLAQMRADLAAMFLLRGIEALEAMDAPYILGSFGGRDNVWNETLLDTPPVAEQRNLMTIAAIASQRHLELVKTNRSSDLEGAEGTLDRLAAGIDAFAEAYLAKNPDDDPTATDTV